jgi:hypothetical protein
MSLHKASHGSSGQPHQFLLGSGELAHHKGQQSQCQGVSLDGCFWKKIEYPPLTNLYRITVPIAPTLSMAA